MIISILLLSLWAANSQAAEAKISEAQTVDYSKMTDEQLQRLPRFYGGRETASGLELRYRRERAEERAGNASEEKFDQDWAERLDFDLANQ